MFSFLARGARALSKARAAPNKQLDATRGLKKLADLPRCFRDQAPGGFSNAHGEHSTTQRAATEGKDPHHRMRTLRHDHRGPLRAR